MESANKSALFVLLVLLGVSAYVWRDKITGFFGKCSSDKCVQSSSCSPASLPKKSKNTSLLQGGPVLVEAFGKPYVSENAFNKKLEQMLQASPYTKNMDPATFPAEAKGKFLKDWVNFLLIKDIWGKQSDVENDPSFTKRFEESVEALRDSLIIEAYVQDLKKKVSVSDEDVSVEFHSNKDRYAKSLGGAHFVVSEHDDIDSAKALQRQCERIHDIDGFIKAAKNNDATNVTDLGFVDGRGSAAENDMARLPMEVRRIIFGRHKDNCLHVAAAGRNYVIFSAEKREPEFFELDEIRPQIKMMLEESKQKEALEKALEQMADDAHLVFNTEVWGSDSRVLSKEELRAAVEAEDAAQEADFDMQMPKADIASDDDDSALPLSSK